MARRRADMRRVTDTLLDYLNEKNGKVYPQIGYVYFADIKGDGRNIKSVYRIINEGGGVQYATDLNGPTAAKRCAAIRAELQRVAKDSA